MKKKIIGISFCLLFSFSAYSQSTEELFSAIDKSTTDTGKVRLLLSLSEALLVKAGAGKKEIDSAYTFMKQADQLSRAIGHLEGHGRSLVVGALILYKKGEWDKGLASSKQALAVFSKLNDLEDEAEATRVVGQYYHNYGKEQEQKIGFYTKAAAMFGQAGTKIRQANTLSELADLQQQDGGNIEAAMQNLRAAMAIYQSLNYKQKLQDVYEQMGDCFSDMGDPVSALRYELQGLMAAENVKAPPLQICQIYNHIGIIYYNLKKYGESNLYYEKALAISLKYHDTASTASVLLNEVNTFSALNKVDHALDLLHQVVRSGYFKNNIYTTQLIDWIFLENYIKKRQFKLAAASLKKFEQDNSKTPGYMDLESLNMHTRYYLVTGQIKRCYPYLKKFQAINKRKITNAYMRNQLYWFQADSSLGRYTDAIKHYQLYKNIYDSVFSEANNKQAQSLQIVYETEKKDKDLQLLKKQAQLTDQEAQSSRKITIGGFSGLVILLGISYNRFRVKRRNNILLQRKQGEIDKQNIALQLLVNDKDNLLNDKENLLNEKDSLISDKDWLLKEVHHRVKNNLQIVMSLLNTQSAFLENLDAISALRESQNRVQSISLIHQKLYMSDKAASISMRAYISDLLLYLADSYGTGRRRIRFVQTVDDINIDISQAVPLGLILNEAITNAIKYAFEPAGGEIVICFRRSGDFMLMLTIADNGRGIPEALVMGKKTSLGMKMMRILSKQLNGSYTISNTSGATISLEFPEDKLMHSLFREKVYQN